MFLKKLKFLDYLIIVFLILGVLVFFNFLRQNEKWVNISAVATGSVFQANSIHPGDFETSSSGKKIAEVIDVDEFDTPSFFDNPIPSKGLVLKLKVLANVDTRSGRLEYKNQPLTVGSQIQFNFQSATIRATVSNSSFENIDSKTYTKILTVNLYNQGQWFADSISVGSFSKDTKGRKIIEVITKEVKPTQITGVSSGLLSQEYFSPTNVDITLKLKTEVVNLGNKFLLEGYNDIAVGKKITLVIGNTLIENGLITKIE